MWKKVVSVLMVIMIGIGLYVSFGGLNIGSFEIPKAKDNVSLGLDLAGGAYVVLEAHTDATGSELTKLMEQTQAVIENRVNEMGLSEPTVTVESGNRIRVELPGAGDSQAALDAIGRTAQLEFVDAWGDVVVTGAEVKDAVLGFDGESIGNDPGISIEFNAEGTDKFWQATKKAIQNRGQSVTNQYGTWDGSQILIVLDGEVISNPSVKVEISGGKAFISGSYTKETAAADAALIRGGSLPVELSEVTTSIVGASLGYDSFEKAMLACAIGVGLIILFMIVVYQIMGIAASVALLFYIVVYMWIFELFGAVLSLPGIFGILLSIGMAVDANIIIFARIREEIAVGKTIRAAVRAGFSRATATIIDSNITTLIAGIVLYQFGTGGVKGFAWTLMIGIIISMISALLITRLFIIAIAESKLLGREKFFMHTKHSYKDISEVQVPVVNKRKVWYSISIAVIVVGFLVGAVRGYNFGIDFTGGTMIQINMAQEQADLTEVNNTLNENDIKATVVYAGENNDQIIIRTSASLDNDKRAEILEEIYKDYDLTQDNLMSVEQFGPAVGSEIQKNALIAVAIACVLMLIYIAIRFELRFGIAAIAALLVDVLTMLSIYGLFHIEMNSPFIAAVLIILGYSINNTIVVFDRVRENKRLSPRTKPQELINTSVRQTLTRTVCTSITTLLSVVALLILGTSSLRSYVFPVMVGLIGGTYSSIFVSGSLWYDINSWFEKKNGKKKYMKK